MLDNYRRLLGRRTADFRGPLFADSDLHKTLEALGREAVRGVREHDGFVTVTQKYADELERGLFNVIAVSAGLSGTDFFTQTPCTCARATPMNRMHPPRRRRPAPGFLRQLRPGAGRQELSSIDFGPQSAICGCPSLGHRCFQRGRGGSWTDCLVRGVG